MPKDEQVLRLAYRLRNDLHYCDQSAPPVPGRKFIMADGSERIVNFGKFDIVESWIRNSIYLVLAPDYRVRPGNILPGQVRPLHWRKELSRLCWRLDEERLQDLKPKDLTS